MSSASVSTRDEKSFIASRYSAEATSTRRPGASKYRTALGSGPGRKPLTASQPVRIESFMIGDRCCCSSHRIGWGEDRVQVTRRPPCVETQRDRGAADQEDLRTLPSS